MVPKKKKTYLFVSTVWGKQGLTYSLFVLFFFKPRSWGSRARFQGFHELTPSEGEEVEPMKSKKTGSGPPGPGNAVFCFAKRSTQNGGKALHRAREGQATKNI